KEALEVKNKASQEESEFTTPAKQSKRTIESIEKSMKKEGDNEDLMKLTPNAEENVKMIDEEQDDLLKQIKEAEEEEQANSSSSIPRFNIEIDINKQTKPYDNIIQIDQPLGEKVEGEDE